MSNSVFQDDVSGCLQIQVPISVQASEAMTFKELTLGVRKMKLYHGGVFANLPLLHLLWSYGKRYIIYEKMTSGS